MARLAALIAAVVAPAAIFAAPTLDIDFIAPALDVNSEIQGTLTLPGVDQLCKCSGLEYYHCPVVTTGFAVPSWCEKYSNCRKKPHPLARMRVNNCEHGKQVWCTKEGPRCTYDSESYEYTNTQNKAAAATTAAAAA